MLAFGLVKGSSLSFLFVIFFMEGICGVCVFAELILLYF